MTHEKIAVIQSDLDLGLSIKYLSYTGQSLYQRCQGYIVIKCLKRYFRF